MEKREIEIESAKTELERIDDWLDEPHLLIGGLAVQRYIVTRLSKDIDLVCEFETARTLVEELYPLEDWRVKEDKDNSYRPCFRVRPHINDDTEIVFGPKIFEREPYEFIDWEKLKNQGHPYELRGNQLTKIIVPRCADLAYTKLISFLARDKGLVAKRKKDLEDLVDLSNLSDFSPIEFLALHIRERAFDYVCENFVLNDDEARIFNRSSFAKQFSLFGKALAMRATVDSLKEAAAPRSSGGGAMPLIESEVVKIAAKHAAKRPVTNDSRNVLMVVDVQRDFFKGGSLPTSESETLIVPLNSVIKSAERHGWTMVFTRDWHPENHHSFEDWGVHCVKGTAGAEFHPELYIPTTAVIADIGTDNNSDGYSPFDDVKVAALISSSTVQTVFVTGMALEFCVLAASRDAVWFKKTVIAVEPLIRAAQRDISKREAVWDVLVSIGAIRAQNIPFPSL